ncbi:MAG: hypothetical protein ABJH63_02305 [Rhizobiaceae bacterium]
MISQFTPKDITHFRPDGSPGYHRASFVVLVSLLLVQLLTVVVVLSDRSDRLENRRIIVEDCQTGLDSTSPIARDPTGRCSPRPIRLPIKV